VNGGLARYGTDESRPAQLDERPSIGHQLPTAAPKRRGNIGVLGAASREFFEQHPAAVARLWVRLIGLRRPGVVPDPPVQLYPFANARGALRAIAARRAKGTVVLATNAGPRGWSSP